MSILFVCLAYLWLAPLPADAEMIDQALFRITLESMWDGADYYSSFNGALDVVYGPERAGVTETVRGFRLPTTFLIWSLLPSFEAVWWLFVGVAGLAGIVASRLVSRPLLGLLVTVYLLSIGMLMQGGVRTAQFLTTELWAVPPMIGSLLMARRERWWMAAGLALVAVSIRELAAPLLITGVALAVLGRIPRAPWLTAFGVAILAYAGHIRLVMPHIDPDVTTNPIVDDVSLPWTIVEMMGFALPAALVLGPILWGLAQWYTLSKGWYLEASLPALPLVGVIIDRPYWGILVAPFALIWGFEQALDLFGTIRRVSASRR